MCVETLIWRCMKSPIANVKNATLPTGYVEDDNGLGLILQLHQVPRRSGEGLALQQVPPRVLLWPGGPPEAEAQHEHKHLVGKRYNSNHKRNSSSVQTMTTFVCVDECFEMLEAGCGLHHEGVGHPQRLGFMYFWRNFENILIKRYIFGIFLTCN